MAKDDLRHRESIEIVKLLDRASHKSGQHRQRVFDDWLVAIVTSLSGGRMESQYMKMIQPYVEGKKGKRAVDLFPLAFAKLVDAMTETRADILGDIFEGAITRGQGGQFLTPEPLAELMAAMICEEGRTLNDPCCGSGRMFLAAAKAHPYRLWEFVGQDIDLRCVRITAINLALWNLYGWVLHGNSLTGEVKLTYRTGFDAQGLIREVAPTDCPVVIAQAIKQTASEVRAAVEATANAEHSNETPLMSGRQLHLFD